MATTFSWAIGWFQDKPDVPAIESALQTQLDEQAAGVPWQ